MGNQPERHIIDLVIRGDLVAARDFAAANRLVSFSDLDCAVSVIAAANWLQGSGASDEVRVEAGRVVEAITKVAWQWVARTPPQPLPDGRVPRDKAAFDALMIDMIRGGGFYHPIEVPSARGYIAPTRINARASDDAYHATEWQLVESLLAGHLGGGLDGRFIVDAGAADGFFSRMLAKAGARVLAIDRTILMAMRTAVLSALNGLQDRITTKLGNAAALSVPLDHMRHAGELECVDAICALGLIYHFSDLDGELSGLLREGVPVVLEFNATDPADEGDYDPARHRDPTAISLPWLVDWLDRHGYETVHEPRWAEFVAGRANAARQEMLLALPRGLIS